MVTLLMGYSFGWIRQQFVRFRLRSALFGAAWTQGQGWSVIFATFFSLHPFLVSLFFGSSLCCSGPIKVVWDILQVKCK